MHAGSDCFIWPWFRTNDLKCLWCNRLCLHWWLLLCLKLLLELRFEIVPQLPGNLHFTWRYIHASAIHMKIAFCICWYDKAHICLMGVLSREVHVCTNLINSVHYTLNANNNVTSNKSCSLFQASGVYKHIQSPQPLRSMNFSVQDLLLCPTAQACAATQASATSSQIQPATAREYTDMYWLVWA